MFETLAAVRVATGPQPPGPHGRWLAAVRPALAGLDLQPIALLQPRRGYTPDFLAPPPSAPAEDFEAGHARIAAADPARVHAELARSLADTPGAAGTALGRRLLDDPEAARDRLAGLVRRAWQALVEPHWPRVRALLDADVGLQARRLAEGGLDRLFDGLHPALQWEAGAVLRRAGGQGGDEVRELGGAGLLLVPSVFKWDQVVAVLDPPWQPALVYPARGAGNLWDPGAGRGGAALDRLIGRSRALILAGLDAPAATTALSHRYALAPGTVSEHLSVLRTAGLVTAERCGHEVRYRRTPLGEAMVGPR